MDEFLNEFYKLRSEYKNNKSKKCINCNRSVGTQFVIEYFEKKRVMKIICGDENKPCELNKEVTIMNEVDSRIYLSKIKKERIEIENRIFELKNKMVYGLIEEENFNKEFDELKKNINKIENEIKMYVDKLEKEELDREHSKRMMKGLQDKNREIEDLELRLNDMIKNIYPVKETVYKDLELLSESSKIKPWSYELVRNN